MACSAWLAASACTAAATWNVVSSGEKRILLDPKCQPLTASLLGPFVKLGSGDVLAVDDTRVMISRDEGKTWSPRPLFADPTKFACCSERTLLRTRNGTLILAFMNVEEMVFRSR